MRRRSGIALVGLFVPGLATEARASEPVPIRIEFDKAAVCSTPDEFYRVLQGRNERVRLALDGERAFGIRVRLVKVGANVRGELSVVHDHGATNARAVEGATCDVVVDALSLTAALALDAVVAEGARGTEAVGETTAQQSGTTAEGSATTTSRSDPAQRQQSDKDEDDESATAVGEDDDDDDDRSARGAGASLGFELGAGARVDQVVSPYIGIGPALVARLTLETRGVFRPGFGAAISHTRNDLFGSPGAASVNATVATVSACPLHVEIGIVAIEPCAVGSGGVLRVSGETVESPLVAERSWWAIGGMLRGSAALGGGFSAFVEAALTVPLVERAYVTAPRGRSVGATAPLSAFVSPGITYAF